MNILVTPLFPFFLRPIYPSIPLFPKSHTFPALPQPLSQLRPALARPSPAPPPQITI